jgi:hypothetical protein
MVLGLHLEVEAKLLVELFTQALSVEQRAKANEHGPQALHGGPQDVAVNTNSTAPTNRFQLANSVPMARRPPAVSR